MRICWIFSGMAAQLFEAFQRTVQKMRQLFTELISTDLARFQDFGTIPR